MAALPTAESLGRVLRERRRGLGWSVDRLAESAGYDRKTILRLEAGDPALLWTAFDVAQALGLSLLLQEASREAPST